MAKNESRFPMTDEAAPSCATCPYVFSQVMKEGLQRAYWCRRHPPSLPMPGPGGQGVSFVHPQVAQSSLCGEHPDYPKRVLAS